MELKKGTPQVVVKVDQDLSKDTRKTVMIEVIIITVQDMSMNLAKESIIIGIEEIVDLMRIIIDLRISKE